MKGWKTYVGTIGWALCEGAKQIYPEYTVALATVQSMIFLPLGVIGVAHKIEKRAI